MFIDLLINGVKHPIYMNNKNIKTLNFMYYELVDLPNKFKEFKKVRNVYLTLNKLYTVPMCVYTFKCLQVLDISYNNIQELSPHIGCCIDLRELNISNNNLSVLPDEIKYLKKLKTLIASGNKFTEIPSQIEYLSKLKRLDFSKNKITTITPKIQYVYKLHSLNLSFNEIRYITRKLSLLKHLKIVLLQNNKIARFTNLSDLYSCKYINISFNKFASTLNLFDYLPINLSTLICTFNNIKSIKVPRQTFNYLTYLEFNSNPIKEFPKHFFNYMPNLNIITLNYCPITQLYDDFYHLRQLKLLTINYTLINDIHLIYNLTNLLYCDLSFNLLTNIPDNISTLQKLLYFNISSNNITNLPIDIILCRFMYFIYNNNPINYNIMSPIIINFLRNKLRGIYNDGENVHSSSIQQGLKNSIINIFKQTETLNPTETLVNLEPLSNIAKTNIEKALNIDIIHSTLYCSFKDVFIRVWYLINKHQAKNDLLKILDNEMSEMDDSVCFVGKITRLVNILSGFYEYININISENEQISAIILNITSKFNKNLVDVRDYEKEYEYEYELKGLIIKELTERGYDKDTINKWCNF